MSKLPDDPKELIRVLNILGSKKKLCEHYNVTRSGLYSYEKRHEIKISLTSVWVVNDKNKNK
jgi:hypothetical protein